MPCWYYEKKDLHSTVSRRDGLDEETEARYRREGARFIMDTGTKMGLSFETCASGVTYFHRFYMFHSFRAYHRCVTAACCLFLAGKVEETPKKCKDIIRITKAMLPDSQFAVFGDDPKEEVITLERILLQTIKFDLQVDHPYSWLLKFAKLLKGDKAKIQKMVQMSWTFINDSLCTTLCLQWEPEIIAIALIHLSSRLSKFEIQDFQGKPANFKGKWWDGFVEDVTLELLEDICHQVLDLYSSNPKKKPDSPPPPPPKPFDSHSPHSKRPRSPVGQDGRRTSQGSGGQPQRVKAAKTDDNRRMFTPTSVEKRVEKIAMSGAPVHHVQPQALPTPTALPQPSNKDNPYMPSKMYTSSFMSQEGSQNIQSLIGGEVPPTYPPTQYAQAAPAVYPTPQQQVPYQQPPSVYQTPATYQQQQPYQSYSQATTQVPYTQPMPEYDTAVPVSQYQAGTVSATQYNQPGSVPTAQYNQPGSVPSTQYNQSAYAQQYTAPAGGYPAQYQAAQPPAQTTQYQPAQAPSQTTQYQAAQVPSQTTQYQAAQPPSQPTQYPSYPPPMQPGSVNTPGYRALPPQMPTFSPVRTPQPPRPTNQRPPLLPMPPTNPLRPTNAPPSNAPRPRLGQPLVRITGRPGW